MAKLGLKHFVAAPLTEVASPASTSYGTGFVVAGAMKADVKIEYYDVKVIADDAIKERKKGFKSGTVTCDVDDLLENVKSQLLGHALSSVSAGGENGVTNLKFMAADQPIYVGFGYYGRVVRSGVTKYRAIWFTKVMFSEPDDTQSTEGDTPAFDTPSIVGTIEKDVTTQWKDEDVFATEAGAIAWLDSKAQITATAAKPSSSVASGTYTSAQSVVLSTTEPSGSIYYTVDGTIPSATNGTQYSATIACAKPSNKCIKAVTVASGKQNSEILELYVTVTS